MAKEIKKKENLETTDEQKVMPFGRQNYIIVLIGIALLVLGFILMLGDSPTQNTPTTWLSSPTTLWHIPTCPCRSGPAG